MSCSRAWYAVRMSKTETAVAREWILGLEPSTWFSHSVVPGRPNVVRTVLHRLTQDPENSVWRVCKGLYWRGWAAGHYLHKRKPDNELASLFQAGRGAGLSGWSALNGLGWTLQCPITVTVSVCTAERNRLPKPIEPSISFVPNENHRRLYANWGEVTVLEGLNMLKYSEELWQDCLERIVTGHSANKLGWPSNRSEIRPDMLYWVCETEPNATADTQHRVGQIVKALNRTTEEKI